MLLDDGILVRKYWFSVSDAEQLKRFRARLIDPVRRWKLRHPFSPWYVVQSDVKKRPAEHDGPPALDHPDEEVASGP
jgi:polyphosphate kinase 2 (PPK2 family)